MATSIEDHLQAASRAVEFARDVRGYHRRRSPRTSTQRALDLSEAQRKIKNAMRPLRSYLGRAPYATQTQAHEQLTERVRAASRALQSERRKIWKMEQNTKKPEAV